MLILKPATVHSVRLPEHEMEFVDNFEGPKGAQNEYKLLRLSSIDNSLSPIRK